jgi:serine/threonine-protein kinase RsbW
MTAKTTSMRIKNDLGELETICQHLQAYGQANGLDRKVIFEINLAIDEIFTNIVSYAFDDEDAHWVDISLDLRDGEITIEIKDEGKAFDPQKTRSPDVKCAIEERYVGGLGIHLIKNLMDDMCYRREKMSNILTLKKKIQAMGETES